MNKLLAILLLAMASLAGHAAQRQKINFNAQWLLQVGDFQQAEDPSFDDHAWQRVTLPHAFNGDEAFRKDIIHLTDTIVWYRKHFSLSQEEVQGKVFIEFEGRLHPLWRYKGTGRGQCRRTRPREEPEGKTRPAHRRGRLHAQRQPLGGIIL